MMVCHTRSAAFLGPCIHHIQATTWQKVVSRFGLMVRQVDSLPTSASVVADLDLLALLVVARGPAR